jgi:hypothetical protein
MNLVMGYISSRHLGEVQQLSMSIMIFAVETNRKIKENLLI